MSVPIVLVHGVGLDRSMWDGVAARMPGAITYDLLGHGVHRDQRPSMPGFVAQLAEVAPEGACDIVGFSLGALIAQEFALAFPARVRRLVLLNGVFRRTADERAAIVARVAAVRSGGYAANVDEAITRWLPNGGGPAEAVRGVMAGNDPAAYADAYEVFATADAALADRTQTIGAPTLVATGELDPRSTPSMAHALAAALPEARCVVLPGLRHLSPVEAPDVVAELIVDFLS